MPLVNHPVHIIPKNDTLTSSAFIPFCEIGGNASAVGVKISQFSVPVCNIFRPKILNDQLCYEVDLNKFADKDNIESNLKLGFNFLLDYNEDRQVFERNINKNDEISLATSMVETAQDDHALIYLNTIGKGTRQKKLWKIPHWV